MAGYTTTHGFARGLAPERWAGRTSRPEVPGRNVGQTCANGAASHPMVVGAQNGSSARLRARGDHDDRLDPQPAFPLPTREMGATKCDDFRDLSRAPAAPPASGPKP